MTSTPQSLIQARRRAVVSSVAGNALEFYDTTVYAFFVVYFSGYFFPSENQVVSQIYAYFLFGISYLVRPFGGVLLSVYADKVGRKPLIVILMFAMALTTGAIGLLPTYQQVGILAPILLVIIRLIQALAVGGLFSSTTAFLMEFAPPDRRGFYSSMQMVAQAIAPILANLVALSLLYIVGREAISETWWRLPFLLGFLTAPLGYYIHKFVDESPAFSKHMQEKQQAPKTAVKSLSISQTLQQRVYVLQIICCIGMVTVGTVSFFGVSIYLPGYVQTLLGFDDTQRTWLALLAPTFAGLSILISGALSDRLGRKIVLATGVSIYGIVFFGFFYYLTYLNASFTGALIGFALLGFSMGLHWGAVPIIMSESFPIHIRATAMAISYNCTVVLFGAMTPTYMKLLEQFFGHSPYNALIYIGLSIFVSLAACYYWKPAHQLTLPSEQKL